MKEGDEVKFVDKKASERWGNFTFGNVYLVYYTDAGGTPRLRDDDQESWWIDKDDLILVDTPDVTEGWSL